MNQEQIDQVEKLAQAASDMELMLVIYPGTVLDLVFLARRLLEENKGLKAEIDQAEKTALDYYVEREELRDELARYKEAAIPAAMSNNPSPTSHSQASKEPK